MRASGAPQPGTEAHWLSESDFTVASSAEATAKTPVGRLPGPGLPEALAWMFGVVGVQIFVGAVISAVILMVYLISVGAADPQLLRELRTPQAMDWLLRENSKPMLVGGQLMFVVVVLAATWLRLRGSVRRSLGLAGLSSLHGVLVILVVLPLALFCGQLQLWAARAWEAIVVQLPGLTFLDEMHVMNFVRSLAETTSLPMLLLAIAVVPAIAEELVFRGIIGRGMVARWGVPGGVVLTSLFFAVVHIHPAHVAVVIPMGIFLHLIYLATRSFWAPVLVHFLNNGLAIVLTKYPDLIDVKGLADKEPLPPGLFVTATLCVGTVVWLLWQTRREYRTPDGNLWSPGYVTVEQPPEDVSAVAVCRRPAPWPMAVAGMSVLAFAAAFVYAAVTA